MSKKKKSNLSFEEMVDIVRPRFPIPKGTRIIVPKNKRKPKHKESWDESYTVELHFISPTGHKIIINPDEINEYDYEQAYNEAEDWEKHYKDMMKHAVKNMQLTTDEGNFIINLEHVMAFHTKLVEVG